MQIHFSDSWQKILSSEIEKPYFVELLHNVEVEYKTHVCFPPKDKIVAAFDYCSFDDLKVVILGQDPYHGDKEANGLCFSVDDGVAIPPSLKNIFSEINREFDRVFMPTSGNLERWAKQGVLLLNATLTVRKDLPNSHKHLKWHEFTDAVIEKISDEKQGIIFLLWGNFAQKKAKLIDKNKHFILENGHPSPLSFNKAFWKKELNIFSKTNEILMNTNKGVIEW